MSDDTLEIRINTEADTAAVEAAQQQVEALANAAAGAGGGLGELTQAAGEGADAAAELAGQSQDAAGAAGELAEQSREAADAAEELTENTGENKTALEQNARAVQALVQFLGELQRAARNAGDELQSTAGKAMEVGDAADQAGMKGGAAMKAVSVATAAASGNFSGAAMGAGRLLTQLKGIGMTAPQIAVATAVVLGLVKVVRLLATEAENARRALDEIKDTNLTNSINRSRDAYDKLADAIARANDLREQEASHNAAMEDAYTQQELAVLALAKAKELAESKTSEERAVIEARYAREAHAVSAKADARADEKKVADLEAKARGADELAAAIEKRIPQILAQATQKGDESTRHGQLATDAWLRDTRAYHIGETKRLSDEQVALVKEAREARDELKDKRAEAEALRQQADVQRRVNTANETRRQAGDVTADTAVDRAKKNADDKAAQERQRQADEAAQEQKRRADLAAAEDELAAARARQTSMAVAVKSTGDVRDAAFASLQSGTGARDAAASAFQRDRSLGNKTRLADADKNAAAAESAFHAADEEYKRLLAALEKDGKALEQKINGLTRFVESRTRALGGTDISAPPGN